MSTAHYDVIVIGAGPAGYVAAIRCAQLGLKTACVDNWRNHNGDARLGGTFINAGCISSMALLESAKIYQLLRGDIKSHGIKFDNLTLDVGKMVERKNQTTAKLSRQIKDIFDHLEIECIHAHGKLLSAKQVEINPLNEQPRYVVEADNIILATGSKPIGLPCAAQHHDLIIDSSQALNLRSVPKKLGIIGAGIIGLELAGIWNKLGAKVVVLEAQESFLTAADQQIAQEAYLICNQQGLDIRLGARVVSTLVKDGRVKLEYQDHEGTHSLQLDKLIVASGRQPNSDNLTAAEVDLLLDENGFVHVDENCSTSLPGVYAIGDLTLLGPMLAHKGLEEGVFVAEQIAEQHNSINYAIIPNVIYTDPEIAWVGQTEQALKAIGENYRVGIFPFKASARAQSLDKPEGMVKIITQADTDIILGVHIIGVRASDLIAEAVLAMEFSASAEDLARTIHAHPTMSETLHEAALALADRALHLPPGY
ncbi:dihydrolipoyl dehydrogenase [Methylomarinum sp. Ch1-1]|uniref:Dihydrolipoyl dehydrogenase n=1 Tax=Methylomarinum roseum TaxID=3067653 RepID=A0AAU7NSY8_9GAMM|nr:dihydrolipoyl dehydrogenase [Methylomarinum sp. Ch1-1]MDP4519887.1 dihydrolipoyl dehydrogenase [Methylomarinum sp. Ch1-1]